MRVRFVEPAPQAGFVPLSVARERLGSPGFTVGKEPGPFLPHCKKELKNEDVTLTPSWAAQGLLWAHREAVPEALMTVTITPTLATALELSSSQAPAFQISTTKEEELARPGRIAAVPGKSALTCLRWVTACG